MESIAWTLPVLPGKDDVLRRFVEEHSGARLAGMDETRRLHGIKRHSVWIQRRISQETRLIVMMEGDDLKQSFKSHIASNHEFDDWLKGQIADITGFHPDSHRVGLPSELIVDWRSDAEYRHKEL